MENLVLSSVNDWCAIEGDENLFNSVSLFLCAFFHLICVETRICKLMESSLF